MREELPTTTRSCPAYGGASAPSFLKFDNALGLQSKATDLESQVGLLWELH